MTDMECGLADCHNPAGKTTVRIDIGERLDEHNFVADEARFHDVKLCDEHARLFDWWMSPGPYISA